MDKPAPTPIWEDRTPRCTAQVAYPGGCWLQCTEDANHSGEHRNFINGGDYVWSDK